MENIILSIPDMESAHCQARVNKAIKDIDGIQVQKLEAGKLSASVEDNDAMEDLIDAIKKAGYTIGSNNTTSSSSSSTGCCGN
ncbi:heavy-metal-associated domain-containing protein [Flavobacterium sp. LS1R49]|uniref:Heavy-metal-associated domain-containing protein n=1 Tax=Flavobacterium shii TaxID=2987687 RepID=A0A9X3C546_9FLAO|nr:heavy-metal-associated domain-containing protein [Flavobacterium shii]MCV9929759.1 heavy-metal-associated domain-containing protein [Flavobacterium shii]